MPDKKKLQIYYLPIPALFLISKARAAENDDDPSVVEQDIGKSRDASRTDDEVVEREEEAIQLEGLSPAQVKELRERADKFAFQAEVNRMMKLIINSLYKNKEIFLRELISNASDALDKIRLMSLTDDTALAATDELTIKIKADQEHNMLHITDTGIGMTREELIKNLGTIAKSGTSEFLGKITEMQAQGQSTSELIGQFGVGFYSSFLVADRVIVSSKHNNGTQHIWESDSEEFSIIEDPRGDTLGRGTTITLVLKDEADDFLELDTIKNLVKKYSQFINFPIYIWSSKTETVEEAEDEEEEEEVEGEETKSEDDAEVEVEKEKAKKVEKTVWDWELINDMKPVWQRSSKEVEEDEYKAFYKSFSKETEDPMAWIHFTAEGEVTFKSILFVPKAAPRGLFDEYGSKLTDYIKMYVRRVFITDDFHDMMPKYLNFVKGVVEASPFVEQLLKKGYEVLYLTEPVDEYCIQALPEFDGKRFQNVAKEGLQFEEGDDTKEKQEAIEKKFGPLLSWLKDDGLEDKIDKAAISQRLLDSPCALVASQYGWSGNMERIMKAQAYQTGRDPAATFYANQKKTLEINPQHPLIKKLLGLVKDDPKDKTAKDLAVLLFETATLRSGFALQDTRSYADSIERMLRLSLNIDPNAKVNSFICFLVTNG
uniref:Heat shock protein 90, beta (grp94), member 1 n=1 Tax=Eptatretus burgeri TaxID=7764 RepID=A0A8C4QUF9_EPTBU